MFQSKAEEIDLCNVNVDKILEVGLLGQCVFCLRKIGKEMPFSSQALLLDGFLNSFNEVWKYLRSQCRKKASDEEDADIQPDITLNHLISSQSSEVVFHSIPYICEACGGTVQAVGELLKALRTHLKTLLQVILESRNGGKHSRRCQQFEIKLRDCCVEENVLTSTLQLLNSICSTEIHATLKQEHVDHHDDDITSDYNEDEVDSRDEDPDYIFENGKDEFTIKKEQVHMDISDPLEDSSSSSTSVPAKIKRKKRSAGVKSRYHRFRCPVNNCDKLFQKKFRLILHQRSIHPETIPPEVPKFPCTCEKGFFLKRDFDLHLKTDLKTHPKVKVEPKKPCERYTCDMCYNRVDKKGRLEHIISHVGEDYVVKCPNDKCSALVTNSAALQLHTKRYTDCKKAAKAKNVGRTCETCGHVTEGRGQLRTHVQSAHERSAEKNYKCPVTGCEMSFCVRQSVDLHLSAYNFQEITTQKCEHCSKNIKVEEMIKHLKSIHKTQDAFLCPQCPFVFSSRLSLLKHMWGHRNLGILCDICRDGVKYPRYADFRQHYYHDHKIGEKWSCEECDKAYFSRVSLNTHIEMKHTESQSDSNPKTARKNRNPSEKKYTCELCFYDVKFVCMTALQNHEIRVHGKDPFTCDICKKTFADRTVLNTHKKQHAGIVREWKCEAEGCGKVLANKKSWKAHWNSFHGVKKFVCDICGKAFSTIDIMKVHHKNVHLGLRPWVCDECGEGFLSPNVLKNHKRIHTGERPFACPICDQRFRQREVRKRHVIAHEKKGDAFKKKGPMKQIRKRTTVTEQPNE